MGFSRHTIMKSLRLFLLSLSSLLVAACATTAPTVSTQSNQSQLAANSFQPAAGTAGLYVFEEGSLIRADNSHRVFLDGQALGLVSSSSYLYAAVTPGQHTVSCESSQLTFTAEAGKNYFVREKTHLDPGGQILSSTVSIETAAVATPLIKELQTEE